MEAIQDIWRNGRHNVNQWNNFFCSKNQAKEPVMASLCSDNEQKNH